MLKVVHYINQFFAQIGGEEMAHVPAEVREGIVGPGLAFKQAFGEEAEIVATIVCGDSYFNENMDEAKKNIIEMVKKYNPDIFIAGPAFNAGRYGVACGTIAQAVKDELNIPVLTGMYTENPGADMFKNNFYIVSTKNSAAGMRDAVKKMAPLALKLAKGEKIEVHERKNNLRFRISQSHIVFKEFWSIFCKHESKKQKALINHFFGNYAPQCWLQNIFEKGLPIFFTDIIDWCNRTHTACVWALCSV